MTNIKMKVFGSIALMILGNTFLENMLCYLAGIKFIREKFKINVIPIAYTYVLDKPEIRIAKMGNYKFYVNIAEFMGIHLYFYGLNYEQFSALLVSKLADEGDTCIDVGANFGSYTFVMANSVGSNGKVFAFEPQLNLYSLLLDSVEMNQASSFITVDCRGLWSKSGENLKFYLSEDAHNSGVSSLVYHGFSVQEENYIIVETITLTDYFKEKGIKKCKIIKIDVERAELEVVKGMLDLLKQQRIDYIVLEQFPNSEAQNLLTAVNYTGWFINETENLLMNINLLSGEECGNYLFVSPNSLDDFKRNYANLLKA